MQDAVKRVNILISTGAQEAEQARQARIDELSMNGERRPSAVNQLMSQIQELQNKANSLADERYFHSSGASSVPSRPLTILSRSEKPSRELAMPNDTRNAMVLREPFLKAYLLEADKPYFASRIPGRAGCS